MTVILANVSRHLTFIRSSVSYVQKHLNTIREPLEFVQVPWTRIVAIYSLLKQTLLPPELSQVMS